MTNEQTALCPQCGAESLLPTGFTQALIERMEKAESRASALQAFAEETRRQAGRLIAQTQTNPQKAQQMAADLCTKAANVLNQGQMQAEATEENYDLATLPRPERNPSQEE